MLMTESALAGLSLDDALVVIDHMSPKRISSGCVIIRESERSPGDYMLLVLDGEVTVQTGYGGTAEPVVLSVLGPGSLIGEMALLDDAPRVATCIASTNVQAALLTRQALQTLIDQHPAVGARLLLLVAQRVAQRLRETLRKFKSHLRVNKVMREELDLMMLAQVARLPAGQAQNVF